MSTEELNQVFAPYVMSTITRGEIFSNKGLLRTRSGPARRHNKSKEKPTARSSNNYCK